MSRFERKTKNGATEAAPLALRSIVIVEGMAAKDFAFFKYPPVVFYRHSIFKL